MQPKHLALPLLLLATLASNLALSLRAPTDAARASDRDLARRVSRAIQEVAEQVTPAVVSVTSLRENRTVARGSGVIVRADGTLVTNHHVIVVAETVTVTLLDGRRLRARVRGSDVETDLAVLDVAGRGFQAATLSADEPPPIGTWVLAVGNPLGLDHTVTCGIVSARGRWGLGIATYEDFIQTDAAINAGNSGGPLVDLSGQVVGINTAKELVREGNQGLGFAIPAYMVREVVDEILEKGYVERGWFGIGVRSLTPSQAAALGLPREPHVTVWQVLAQSPAEEGGLRVGDVVLAIGGTPIQEQREVLDSIARLVPGSKVAVDVWRDQKLELLLVDVGHRSPR